MAIDFGKCVKCGEDLNGDPNTPASPYYHNCWGNNGNGHPYDFLLRYEQGKRTCKVTLNYHQGGLKKVSEEKEVKI